MLGTLCLIAGVGAPQASASQPEVHSAFFIDSNGAVASFGQAADHSWNTATEITATNVAPPGGGITAVRSASGTAVAYFVGNNGSIYRVCSLLSGQATPITNPGTAVAGGPIAAVLADGQIRLMTAASDVSTPRMVLAPGDGNDPCKVEATTSSASMALPATPPVTLPAPNLPAKATITAVGLSNGDFGVFYVDSNHAVHASWTHPNGSGATDLVLTGDGTPAPGGGITVTPNANADPTPGSLSLFYTGKDGRVFLARPAPFGPLIAEPNPQPWTTRTPSGAPLAAAVSPTGSAVSYVAIDGKVTALPVDATGAWDTVTGAVAATNAGASPPGSGIGLVPNGDWEEGICGPVTNRPGHLPIHPPGGPGTIVPVSTVIMVVTTTIYTAV
ncbi:hypothetical protein GCM10009765_37910 [Fodinicola feengrottensis]|uniref:Uncharacterized protein n=1 Tax=Fodinicola feengrottensis TaxID=435914 RepID=A0ABN2HC36_9ACTN